MRLSSARGSSRCGRPRVRSEESGRDDSEARESSRSIGILWRGERREGAAAGNRLFEPLAAAFAALGVRAEPVIYCDDAVAEVRSDLVHLVHAAAERTVRRR